jgi:hypothetical protein
MDILPTTRQCATVLSTAAAGSELSLLALGLLLVAALDGTCSFEGWSFRHRSVSYVSDNVVLRCSAIHKGGFNGENEQS